VRIPAPTPTRIALIFALGLLSACGENERDAATEPSIAELRDGQPVQPVTDPHRESPPPNPFLADSSWSVAHSNSYSQASTPWAGPIWGISEQEEDFLPNPNTGVFLFSGPYPDGSRAIWIQGPTRLSKIDPNGVKMRLIDSVETKPPLWPRDMNMDTIGRMSNRVFSKLLAHVKTNADIERREGEAPYGIDGVYIVLDHEGTLFQSIGQEIIAYGDAIPGDRLSKIIVKRRFQIPAKQLTRPWDRIIGMGMTYDGRIAFVTNYATVGVVDRDFEEAQFVQLGEAEYVFNSLATDEEGGIYIVTHERVHRVQWTGERLSLDAKDGAWSAAYETGWSDAGKWAEGTGATPTLMGSGDGDKFLVIPDGQQLMHVVLFWRGEIPEDWEQLPGTKDRRIAAQAPITFGRDAPETSWTENSVLVRGYGIFIANNQMKEYEGLSGAQRIVMAGEPEHAPYGIEKFEWDPATRTLRSIWANAEVSLPTSTPAMSSATNLIYGAGQRDGVWSLEAIDWSSGESTFHYLLGNRVRHNSGMSTVAVGPDGAIYYGTFLGLIRIRP